MKQKVIFCVTAFIALSVVSCSSGTEHTPDTHANEKETKMQPTDPANRSNKSIRLSVADPVSVFAIPVKSEPGNLKKYVSDAIAKNASKPMRDLALKQFSTPYLATEIWPKDRVLFVLVEMLRESSTAEEIKDIQESAKYVVFKSVGQPGWPPSHEFAIRTAVACVAKELHGTIIDLSLPATISVEGIFKQLPPNQETLPIASMLNVLCSADDKGLWMTTRGLGRIGLIEVQSVDLPPQLDRPWT